MIAESLKINKNLKTLMIEKNNIGDVGADYLLDCLKINSTLTHINILINSISTDKLDKIDN
jgi:hypothetical protein